jgi:menaquinone-specific isochorismate synthase
MSAELHTQSLPTTVSDYVQVLARKIDARLDQTGERPRADRIARVEVEVPATDAVSWLSTQAMWPRLFWEDREASETIAAVGAAVLLTGRTVPSMPPDMDDRVRFFGGLRFDLDGEVSAEWRSFGRGGYVLPRFELLQRVGRTYLACNLVLPRDVGNRKEILKAVRGLPLGLEEHTADLPSPVSRTDEPDRSGWRSNVSWALDAFSSSRLGKVVLARRASLELESELDALQLFGRLRSATPGCFHFYFEPTEDVAFLGASPERLYKRNDRRVWSEAVAGTRPRGESDDLDDALREELMLSEKDQREHEYVRQSIKEALDDLCSTLHMDDRPAEMRLRRGRHLHSGLWGILKDGVTDAALLTALHPTPAVGGYPRQDAISSIAYLEAFDRGWYAGPVGWVGRTQAEFAVGIRSALVERNRISLYSGAGIVRGSDPDSEWAEIEQKISDFLKVLGINERGI